MTTRPSPSTTEPSAAAWAATEPPAAYGTAVARAVKPRGSKKTFSAETRMCSSVPSGNGRAKDRRARTVAADTRATSRPSRSEPATTTGTGAEVQMTGSPRSATLSR